MRPRPAESRLGRWLGLAFLALFALFALVASVGAAGGGVVLATVMSFTQNLPDPVAARGPVVRAADHRL